MNSETNLPTHQEDIGAHFEEVRAYCDGMHRIYEVAREVRAKIGRDKHSIVDLTVNALSDPSLQPLVAALAPSREGEPLSQSAIEEIKCHAWIAEGLIRMNEASTGPASASLFADLISLKAAAKAKSVKA